MDAAAQEADLVAPRVGAGVITTRDTQFHVDFRFSCHLLVREYYDDLVVLRQIEHTRITSRFVRMDIKQLMTPECSRGLINRELRDWPLADEDRRNISEFALSAVKDLIRLMPPQHNVLAIPLQVLVARDRRVSQPYPSIHRTAPADSSMVPATDASIKSLEIKTITSCEIDGESCSICLEDFYVGCEVVSMPCSHVFDEGCIKKWLKSSHYCPICRFEMPTSC